MTNNTNTNTATEDRLLSAKEAMAVLGLSRSKLYALIAAGRIPARKLDRKTVFLARDLQEFMASLPVRQV